MKKYLCLIPLLLSLSAGFAPAVEEVPDRLEYPETAYDRAVALVALRRAAPERIRENLALLNRNWGIFPTLQYLELPVGEGGGELLFLRGRQEEVAQAARIAEEMDRFYPGPIDPVTLSPIPLGHLSGPSMRDQLLALSRAAGLELKPEQLLLFPPGSGASLFFRGPTPEAKRIGELKAELDQPRHGTVVDIWSGFASRFRGDLFNHFLTVSTYAASALLLLGLHFLLARVPWLGPRYQRWFTLIWTRLIQDIRGRDFAYEVLKSLAETAVDSVEQASRRPLGAAGGPDLPESGERKKSRAMAIARDLAAFRGYNPDDPEIKRLLSDLVEAAVFRLDRASAKK
jgi:hypothetical protein